MRKVFRSGKTLIVFNLRNSVNSKITKSNTPIVQQYSFSREQYEAIKNGGGYGEFIVNDAGCCFDCPFSNNQGYKWGKCYTHKFPQVRGFLAMLREIAKTPWSEIPEMPLEAPESLVGMCKGRYVRFGSYGETCVVPAAWYEAITGVAKNWTGYTHQWHKTPELSKWLMASVHNLFEQKIAEDMGFRVFAITQEGSLGNKPCPTQKSDKVACDTCGMCSGTSSKMKKSIEIVYH